MARLSIVSVLGIEVIITSTNQTGWYHMNISSITSRCILVSVDDDVRNVTYTGQRLHSEQTGTLHSIFRQRQRYWEERVIVIASRALAFLLACL